MTCECFVLLFYCLNLNYIVYTNIYIVHTVYCIMISVKGRGRGEGGGGRGGRGEGEGTRGRGEE